MKKGDIDNIEKNILKEIYDFEKKNTALFVIRIALLFTAFIFLFYFALTGTYTILIKQQSFDFLELFQQDFETIRLYLFDVLFSFYDELPKLHFLFLGVTFFGLISSLYVFNKNYKKIGNKIKAMKVERNTN